MAGLTTLIARLDGLRVAVARQVRDRALYTATGARNLGGWLRADPRLAEEAWKITRLAAMAPELPRVTGLLADGKASLDQAGAAAWQIGQLPDGPRKPPVLDQDGCPADPAPTDQRARDDGADGERWAGLWLAGDLHAAADELFADHMPGLDPGGLRQMGTHMREAADPGGHARDEADDYRSRAFRISESLGGRGEISGRVHPEAAAQLISTFEELGAKSGPGDERTKAQRWADALVSLAGRADTGPASPLGGQPDSMPDGEPGDDQPCHDHGHGGNGQLRLRPGGVPAGLRRPRMIVITPIGSLLRRPLAPGAVLPTGAALSAEAARRIACDAQIVRVVTAPPTLPGPAGDGWTTGQLKNLLGQAIAGLPPPLAGPAAALDIGRASQGWTPRQRDAIYARFGGRCGWPPGCESPIDVIHHRRHWADGGPTSVDNGWPGCGYHHWLIHEGGWRLLQRPDGRLTAIPPPRGWKPGTIFRNGQPVTEIGADPPKPDQSAA
jgi:hypothetical protein